MLQLKECLISVHFRLYVLLNYQPYLRFLHITIQTSKVCVSNPYEAGCCWTTHGHTTSHCFVALNSW